MDEEDRLFGNKFHKYRVLLCVHDHYLLRDLCIDRIRNDKARVELNIRHANYMHVLNRHVHFYRIYESGSILLKPWHKAYAGPGTV